MKKLIVIGEPEQQLADDLSGLTEWTFQYAALEDVPPDTACVLLAQPFTEDACRKAVSTLRKRGIPFGAVTFSDETSEQLLDWGIVHILNLPMTQRLFGKRIAVLASPASDESASDSATGFELFSALASADEQNGAYVVSEGTFTNLYQFVLRLQERMEKQAQLVQFSFHTRLNTVPEPGIPETALPIVQKCLRRGDIVSICGHAIFAILMGADSEGGRIAAERIVNTYQAHFCNSIYDMQYEMREIS